MDKVSHVQFIENLASKLGLTEEETVKKLTELILSIKKESASGEMVIDGLGTFTTTNKELTFVPDESFELEINHNYAGMIPVLIEEPGTEPTAATRKADDEAEADDDSATGIASDDSTGDFEEEEFVDVIDEQDPFDLDDEDDEVTGKETAESESVDAIESEAITEDAADKVRKAALEAEEKKIKEEEAAAEKAETEIEQKKAATMAATATASKKASQTGNEKISEEKTAKETAKETADSDHDTSVTADTGKETSKTKTGSDDDIQPKWVEPGSDTTPESKEAPISKEAKPDKKEIPPHDRVRPDSNSGTIIAILVAAIVVVAGALYLFGFLSDSPSDTTTPVVSEQTDSPPAIMDDPEAGATGESDAAISEMERLAEEEAARDITAQPDTPAEEEPAPPPAEVQVTENQGGTPAAASFGLRGTMSTALERPYTIVVHSLASRTDAEREAAGLSGAGYRSTYFRVELPNGSVRWRVAIGQFRSSNSAVEAAMQLPDPYLTNHFISRIESYNP